MKMSHSYFMSFFFYNSNLDLDVFLMLTPRGPQTPLYIFKNGKIRVDEEKF